ncbi:MAG: hypothetical protein SLAVMIC_00260 [uncultured marine phage]|uniref:Uncharacterized protein n=1 Tax=uncultured marine phage TaxID=707152 RepID=A0A8D9C8M0_9VIRU|nr:MAG: hypothetical protein SLAVMIC_00260 [uncultured marine phage]
MEIELEQEKPFKVVNNMVRSFKVRGNTRYQRAKLMCIMSMKQRSYYNLPFETHIKDIEQTLIDYGIKEERFFTALWVANCSIPFKKKIELFGRDTVRLAFAFNRGNLANNINSITDKQKLLVNDDIVTLHLAQRITNINFAINNADNTSYDMYVKAHPDYKKALKRDVPEHKQMWEYMKLCMEDAGSINALFFYI